MTPPMLLAQGSDQAAVYRQRPHLDVTYRTHRLSFKQSLLQIPWPSSFAPSPAVLTGYSTHRHLLRKPRLYLGLDPANSLGPE